jgi:hypothetical protein
MGCDEGRATARAGDGTNGYSIAVMRMKYHVAALADGDGSNHQHDWQVIVDTAGEWIESGFPASDKAITEVLAGLDLDAIPDDLDTTGGAQRVLEAVDTYQSLQQQSRSVPEPPVQTYSDEVTRLAELLRDRVLVLVGGELRPHAKQALESALGLKELKWLTSRSGQSIEPLATAIRGADAAAVLLAIRWASHAFGDLVHVCNDLNVPFVRLKAGYSPNAVAHAVLEQAGERLGSS